MYKPEDMTVLEIENMLGDICHFVDQYRTTLTKDEKKKISATVSLINAYIVNNLNPKRVIEK